jgi:linalool dehydratase/isomerase-like protein
MATSRRDFVRQVGATAGATALGLSGAAMSAQAPVTGLGPEPNSPFPALNRRTRGWLRFLWEKTTTPDDWSSSGVPHQWWDVYTNPVVTSYGRFDLQTSSYALLLMADQTPAWREVYTRVADGLASRFPTYWGAIDWLTQIGDDPKRANYPEEDMLLMPQQLRGKYNRYGWTANGIEPWGLQRDPIGADGYLFFRGWFNLVLSIYKYVSGDGKWERPFMVTGFGDEKFEWDHARIADLLERQYTQHEAGPHCENTKVWFSCNSAAALGLYLYDRLHGTRKHRPVESWFEYARHNYMKISRDGKLESVTRYYDPLVDYKLNIAPDSGVNIAFLLVPQQRELATLIYDAAANALGWRNPAAAIRASAPGLLLARELGDHAVVSRLSAAAENEYEPRFFGNRDEKFGWFFRLNEAYPRGQQSATMMVSEVGEEGAWTRAFEAAHRDKFSAPTVEGIDYPSLGVYQAWNDRPTGILRVGTYAATPDRRGAETSWRVTNLPKAADVSVRCDGEPFNRLEIVGNDTIRLNTTIDSHAFEIFTRNRVGERDAKLEHREAKAVTAATNSLGPMAQDPEAVSRASADLLAGRGPSCPCCSG